jgi:ribonuclease HIII
MERVNYLSEITNTLTKFPVFKNQKLNAEIYKNYTNSYKTIQTLKTSLPKDDLELLNRYLAKIKTNISLIDSFDSTESK